MMSKAFYIPLCLASALVLSACQKEATGQVAAVVNGEEITLQEINAELRGVNLTDGSAKKAAQQAALQRIVERRLLAGAATEDGIAKEQEYLLRSRQVGDALLVQMLSEKADRSIQIPSDADIQKFIAANPVAFDNRTIFTTNQIQFVPPKDPKVLALLEPDRSMDAVAAHLTQLGIKFSRRDAELDSIQLPKGVFDQIIALPGGEPFILPAPQVVTIAVITGQRTSPVTGDEAKALAAQGLRNKTIGDLIQQRLKAARASAKISYQQGYVPNSKP